MKALWSNKLFPIKFANRTRQHHQKSDRYKLASSHFYVGWVEGTETQQMRWVTAKDPTYKEHPFFGLARVLFITSSKILA
jgi:hypothetical protein